MREIKFRGKNIKGEWVYGSLLISEIDVNQKFINAEIHERFADSFSIKKHVVNHETVGQFTGLTDKNGKEIYEGDIIGIHKSIGGVCRIGYCVFEKGKFINKYSGTSFTDELGIYGVMQQIEIIGNIHENKELLNSQP